MLCVWDEGPIKCMIHLILITTQTDIIYPQLTNRKLKKKGNLFCKSHTDTKVWCCNWNISYSLCAAITKYHTLGKQWKVLLTVPGDGDLQEQGASKFRVWQGVLVPLEGALPLHSPGEVNTVPFHDQGNKKDEFVPCFFLQGTNPSMRVKLMV